MDSEWTADDDEQVAILIRLRDAVDRAGTLPIHRVV